MFALVNDVARYPEFLPWCVGRPRRGCRPRASASPTLKMARGVLRTEFTTRNTLQPGRADPHAAASHGPFRDLSGEWRFDAIGESRLARAVSGRVRVQESSDRARAFNAVFEALCGTIVDAFVLRAQTGLPEGS